MTKLSRRSFLAEIAAGSAAALAAPAKASVPAKQLDPHRIAVISDIHTGMPWSRQQYRTGYEYPHMPRAAEKLVAEILSQPVLPANVIGLGDISLAFGEEGDYEIAAKVLKPLQDAGIKVTLAMGNHDIRAEFAKHFPGYDKTTKIPGKIVSVVETPDCDFILLDSLVEPTKRGSYPAVTGAGLGQEQIDWLTETLKKTTKPTFVCSHHMANTLKIERLCVEQQAVVGYLHGHHHHWMTNYLLKNYRLDTRRVRMMGFPTLGLDTDVGWAMFTTDSSKAMLRTHARAFYFPMPREPEKTPAAWSAFVRDWNERDIEFNYSL